MNVGSELKWKMSSFTHVRISRRRRRKQPWDEWSSMHIIFMAYCNDIWDSINHSTDFSSDIFMFRSYVSVMFGVCFSLAYNFVVFSFCQNWLNLTKRAAERYIFLCILREAKWRREREREIEREENKAENYRCKCVSFEFRNIAVKRIHFFSFLVAPKMCHIFSWPIPCLFYRLHKIFIHIISWLFRLCHIIQIEMIFSGDHARLFVWLLQFWWVRYIKQFWFPWTMWQTTAK